MDVGREGAGGAIQRQVPFPTSGNVGGEAAHTTTNHPSVYPNPALALAESLRLGTPLTSLQFWVNSLLLFNLSSPATPSSRFLQP